MLYDNIGMPVSVSKETQAVAQALRERRLALGESATQERIAQRAGMSVRHLQKIESGATASRIDTLLSLARALDTNLQSLLDRAETLRRRR
jgi:transcriptional regulator with XRE-family HTH domain